MLDATGAALNRPIFTARRPAARAVVYLSALGAAAAAGAVAALTVLVSRSGREAFGRH